MTGSLRTALGSLLLAGLLSLAACGYTAGDADRDYLRAFCLAVDEFSDRLARGSAGPALELFERDLEAIQPPPRLKDFHHDFIAYVKAAADPETLVRGKAPRPDRESRSALAAIERDIDECWEATYFETVPD